MDEALVDAWLYLPGLKVGNFYVWALIQAIAWI
jgi:hypothetical protein